MARGSGEARASLEDNIDGNKQRWKVSQQLAMTREETTVSISLVSEAASGNREKLFERLQTWIVTLKQQR